MRRYPLFSSPLPLNNIIQHEAKGEEEKKPAEISTLGELGEEADLMQVATLFEEQNSIESLLSEIREIENIHLDIASLVSLRTVNSGQLSHNQLGRGQEQVAGQEEENLSWNIDLRSNPIEEVLTLF